MKTNSNKKIDKKNIKVAYFAVVHSLHDHRFLYKQCKGLADQGFDVSYLVKHNQEETIQGVKIVPISVPENRLRRFLNTFKLFGKARKFEAIHLADPELLPLGILVRLFTGTKVIFDAHEDYIDFMKYKYYLPKWVRGTVSFLLRILFKISGFVLDGFVFADEGTAKEYRLSEKKKFIFYNFPRKSLFPDSHKEWDKRKYDLVFLGSMSETSGTFVILNSIKKLKTKFPNLRVLFIGQPGKEIQDEVQHFIEENQIKENVHFTGRIPHGDVPNLLQDCKIGLIALLDLPKFHKNIATKMFEYMASGIPVVSSDLPPERRFLIEDKTAKLFEPGDPDSLTDAIDEILSDVEFGKRLHFNCLEIMDEKGYYAETQIEGLAAFYEKILEKG